MSGPTAEQRLEREARVLWDAITAIRDTARKLEKSGDLTEAGCREIEGKIRASEIAALDCWKKP